MMTITERDELGRATKSVLSRDQASKMGKQSHAKRGSETADKILAEAGYDDDNPASEQLKVLVDYGVSGKSGAVAALRDVRRITSTEEAATGPAVAVRPGNKCPTCHQYVLADMQIADDEMDSVIDDLDL